MTSFVYLAIFIASLLSIASIYIRNQCTQDPSAENLKNKQRLLVWWMIYAFFLLVFQLGEIAVYLSICGLLYWSSVETFSLFKKQLNRYHIIYLCFIMFIFGLLTLSYPQHSKLVFVFAITIACLVYRLSITSLFFIPAFGLYCCFSLFSVLLILKLAQQASLDYSYLLLVLFFVTSVNDIAQYVMGSMIGKTPIASNLSPNKTVAGLWGGILVSSVLCVFLLPAFLSISSFEAFAIGSLIALAGFLGDLIISKLKRGLQVKDSGTSIIGHGGILDRIDSLLLTAPVFGIFLQFKGYL